MGVDPVTRRSGFAFGSPVGRFSQHPFPHAPGMAAVRELLRHKLPIAKSNRSLVLGGSKLLDKTNQTG